jgi:Cdc6-like AAA superfamily ATPase
MKTPVSLSQIGLYNPQRQSAELTEALFVVRQKEFNLLMESLSEEAPDGIPQHHLVIAQRGMGKTTLLKRLEVELHKKQYRKKFIPLLLPEEQYNLTDLSEFWLNCLNKLLESLETETSGSEADISKIEENTEKIKQEYRDSSDLNERLYSHLISICKNLRRRPVLLIDNIGFAFHRLRTTEQ